MSEAKVNAHNNCKSETQVWSQAGKPPSSSNLAQMRPTHCSLNPVNNHQDDRQQVSKCALAHLWEGGSCVGMEARLFAHRKMQQCLHVN